ncbi:MAG: hypothetical protein ACRD3W_00205, partial [Terriglobales bacterium]
VQNNTFTDDTATYAAQNNGVNDKILHFSGSNGDQSFQTVDGDMITRTQRGGTALFDKNNNEIGRITDQSGKPIDFDKIGQGQPFDVSGIDGTLAINSDGDLSYTAPASGGVDANTLKQLVDLGVVASDGAYDVGGAWIKQYTDATGDEFADIGNGMIMTKTAADCTATLPDGTKIPISADDYDELSNARIKGAISLVDGKLTYTPPADGTQPDAATLKVLSDLNIAPAAPQPEAPTNDSPNDLMNWMT